MVAGIWLLIVSYLLYSLWVFVKKLVKGTDGEDLKKVMQKIWQSQDKNNEFMATLEKKLKSLDEEGRLHIQKLGLVRFNPFKELGGEHSFSMALLNGTGTGIVITGIHTRERTRLYVKDIKKGKSELELSNEEKKALAKADKI